MLSTYTQNKLQDWYYRKQPFTLPDNFYIALCTTLCTPSELGTEVTGGDYSRVALERSLDTFSGTQGLGTTTVSTGTSGEVFNNEEIEVGVPTAPWGSVVSIALMDSLVDGNMLEYFILPEPKVITSVGDPVVLQPGNFKSTLTSS